MAVVQERVSFASVRSLAVVNLWHGMLRGYLLRLLCCGLYLDDLARVSTPAALVREACCLTSILTFSLLSWMSLICFSIRALA